jgi:hypothetical protein
MENLSVNKISNKTIITETESHEKDENDNDLTFINKEKGSVKSGNKVKDSAFDIIYEEEVKAEFSTKDEFVDKLKIWSNKETKTLNGFERNTDSLHRESVWQIRDKFKTLRRIKKGNTRKLTDQFENLC